VALEEILKGKVQVNLPDDEGAEDGEAKPKRRSRAKASAEKSKK
jgi:hypothetical protein